jgi:polyisoprenoid-binding protein YceI
MTGMTKWFFEPGHTAAEFSVRHMMVTNVRGHFKNIHGRVEFDPDSPSMCRMDVVIDATQLWTGEPERDAHLKSADFLDVERFPEIRFRGGQVKVIGRNDYLFTGDLTIRGVTRSATLEVRYLGEWSTPWWEDGVDKGPKRRAGFVARTTIPNRHEFGVSWNSSLENDGVVVGDEIEITIDVELIAEER